MTVQPGWPAVSGAATFQHIRRSLAGQVVKSAAGVLRKGLLPVATTSLVTGTATMNVAVGAFVAVLDRNGAVFVPNDGSVNVLLSSAPASGSRWSIVYVKQRESEAPFSDGADGPVLDKVESTTSEALARAALPAGALELAVVKVDAGSANTNAVGVTITQTAPFTAMEGGAVVVRNDTELQAWQPHDGSLAERIDNAITYKRVGGAWVPETVHLSLLKSAAQTSLGSPTDVTFTAAMANKGFTLPTLPAAGFTIPYDGDYEISASGVASQTGGNYFNLSIVLDGVTIIQQTGAVYPHTNAYSYAHILPVIVAATAGDIVKLVGITSSTGQFEANSFTFTIRRLG